jgi:hypothetical protein
MEQAVAVAVAAAGDLLISCRQVKTPGRMDCSTSRAALMTHRQSNLAYRFPWGR